MKKNNLYLFNLLAISVIVFVVGYFSMNYLIKVSTNQFLEIQIESSKREAREFSNLIANQVAMGADRDALIGSIQRSIEGSNTEYGFICMFDWSGIEICHPDPQKIGKQITPDESYVRPVNSGMNSEDFYELLKNKKQQGGVREFNSERSSEIIYLYPVENTDWIIAAHANIDKIEKEINELKVNFLYVYLLTSLSIIVLSLFMVRYLGNYYEHELELKNEILREEVLSLSKLNADLSNYKEKISSRIEQESGEDADEEDSDLADEEHTGNSKITKRLLTYSKDKLISVRIEDIAFIHTENSITYITCLDGRKFTTNSSLDELFQRLDHSIFFRANRQYILSVKGIDEILRYGNSQLKIKTQPSDSVIISKNRVSDFKKWLEM